MAAVEDDVTAAEVGAGPGNAVPWGGGAGDEDRVGLVVGNACVFDHNDGVGAPGDDGPGGDGDGCAGFDFAVLGVISGGDAGLENGECDGVEFFGAVSVFGLDGEAIDVAAVEARDVDGGAGVFGEDPAEDIGAEGHVDDAGFDVLAECVEAGVGGRFIDHVEELTLFHGGSRWFSSCDWG